MKRGQHSIEYIITYGWALMGIAALLTAILYFVPLSPGQYLPDRCFVTAQFTCEDYVLEENGGTVEMKIQLRNDFSRDVTITDIRGTNPRRNATNCNTPSFEVKETQEITCDVLGPIADGSKYSVPFIITMRRDTGGAPTYELAGEVFTTLEG